MKLSELSNKRGSWKLRDPHYPIRQKRSKKPRRARPTQCVHLLQRKHIVNEWKQHQMRRAWFSSTCQTNFHLWWSNSDLFLESEQWYKVKSVKAKIALTFVFQFHWKDLRHFNLKPCGSSLSKSYKSDSVALCIW